MFPSIGGSVVVVEVEKVEDVVVREVLVLVLVLLVECVQLLVLEWVQVVLVVGP